MSSISPQTLAERLRTDPDVLPVDIRPEDEFTAWHIPESAHVDVLELLRDDPDKAKPALARLPKDKDLVTVCGIGITSRTATDVLRELGYSAVTLEDGMYGWSQVHKSARVPVDIPGMLVQVTRPGKGCLSYVLVSDGEAVVVDPSQYVTEYDSIIEEYDATLVGVFDTHAHADHVSGGRELATRHGVPYYLHPLDAINLDATPVEHEHEQNVGSVRVRVIHTPGHSPGSVTYAIDGRTLLTGDTVFHRSVGRVELGVEAGIEDSDVKANAETLYESLQRIQNYPGDSLVLPAHDPGSPFPPVAEPLSRVVEQNPDLQLSRAAFIEKLAGDVPEHPPNFQRVKAVNTGTESPDDDDLGTLELGPNRCAAE